MNQHRWHRYLLAHKYWTIQRTNIILTIIIIFCIMYLITVDTSISMFDESFWTFTSVGTNCINTQILAFVLFSPEKRYFWYVTASPGDRNGAIRWQKGGKKLTGIRRHPYKCHFLWWNQVDIRIHNLHQCFCIRMVLHMDSFRTHQCLKKLLVLKIT